MGTIRCARCREKVRAGASFCRHCQHQFSGEEASRSHLAAKMDKAWVLILVCVVGALAFFAARSASNLRQVSATEWRGGSRTLSAEVQNPAIRQISTLPARQRYDVWSTAIRSAGFVCEDVKQDQLKGASDGTELWLAGCVGGRDYLVSVNASSKATVLNCEVSEAITGDSCRGDW